MKYHPVLFFSLLFFLGRSWAAEPIPVELSSIVKGADPEGTAAFILEMARAELGNGEGIELVDRSDLQKGLDELGLAEAALTSGTSEIQRLGNLVGVRYYCTGSILRSGENRMMSVRVVQVATSVYKLAVLKLQKDADVSEAGAELAKLITDKIAQLEKRPDLTKQVREVIAVPEDAERPIVAVRMLETAFASRPAADPASEISLIEHLKGQKIKTVQLSKRGQSTQPGQRALLEGEDFKAYIEEAKAADVEVVILGEAFSETAGRLGSVVSSRARVEVHVIRVADQEVILTASGYGAASDIAELTAGKKAIEAATEAMCRRFPSELVSNWNTAATR